MKKALPAVLLLSAGCSAIVYEDGKWPVGLPPRAYYDRVYAASPEVHDVQNLEDYYTWVLRFYYGYSLAEGWIKSEKIVFKEMNEEEYRMLAPKLAYLGQLMSGEWAKHNERRRIHTNMLALWGRIMRKGIADHRLEPVIDRIIADVKALIFGEIEGKEIAAARYKDILEPAANGNGEK